MSGGLITTLVFVFRPKSVTRVSESRLVSESRMGVVAANSSETSDQEVVEPSSIPAPAVSQVSPTTLKCAELA